MWYYYNNLQGNYGCNGGWMDYAFNYAQSQSLDIESCYPYKAQVFWLNKIINCNDGVDEVYL